MYSSIPISAPNDHKNNIIIKKHQLYLCCYFGIIYFESILLFYVPQLIHVYAFLKAEPTCIVQLYFEKSAQIKMADTNEMKHGRYKASNCRRHQFELRKRWA
ncbi:hypothetical protein GOODEAATRI_027990 [Goodea atripinnis]|uniref:Uncharacterized protein n=1 Tax=Goodea atripinnis TaxID=208336 RepID=A0ABV0PSA6_9TELE